MKATTLLSCLRFNRTGLNLLRLGGGFFSSGLRRRSLGLGLGLVNLRLCRLRLRGLGLGRLAAWRSLLLLSAQ